MSITPPGAMTEAGRGCFPALYMTTLFSTTSFDPTPCTGEAAGYKDGCCWGSILYSHTRHRCCQTHQDTLAIYWGGERRTLQSVRSPRNRRAPSGFPFGHSSRFSFKKRLRPSLLTWAAGILKTEKGNTAKQRQQWGRGGDWVTLSYALHCLDALPQVTDLTRLQPPGREMTSQGQFSSGMPPL